MKLLVKTLDTLQIVGLTTLLNQYIPIVNDIPANAVGVVFDNETLRCAYVPAGASAKFEKMVDASIGIEAIRRILMGVIEVKTLVGSVLIIPNERTVELKNTTTLTFDDIENIRAKITPVKSPTSLVGSTMVFDYYKPNDFSPRRVVRWY